MGRDLVREDALGDGEEGDARGRGEVDGGVGGGGDARDGAEDDPGRVRRLGGGRHFRAGGGGDTAEEQIEGSARWQAVGLRSGAHCAACSAMLPEPDGLFDWGFYLQSCHCN